MVLLEERRSCASLPDEIIWGGSWASPAQLLGAWAPAGPAHQGFPASRERRSHIFWGFSPYLCAEVPAEMLPVVRTGCPAPIWHPSTLHPAARPCPAPSSSHVPSSGAFWKPPSALSTFSVLQPPPCPLLPIPTPKGPSCTHIPPPAASWEHWGLGTSGTSSPNSCWSCVRAPTP